jgi:hypothetical protein
MPRTPLFRVLLTSAPLLFAGCASTDPGDARMERVDANRAEYETWPLTVKEAVLEGRVTRGMDPVMVHVALGRPDEEIKEGESVVWVYHRGESYQVYNQPHYSPIGVPGPNPMLGRGVQNPAQDPLATQRQTIGRGQSSQLRNPQIPEPPPQPTVVRDSRYDIEVVFRDGLVVAGNGVR